MKLHRTPVHHTAAEMVRNGAIRWQVGKTAGGGWFIHANGAFPAAEVLVALAEMRQAHLIERSGTDVVLTEAGEARLSEWDATRMREMVERAQAVKR